MVGVHPLPLAEEVPMCSCGCGAELTDSLYWATEICHIRWLSRQGRTDQLPARAYRSPYSERLITED
jgi:hypothetical protein